MRNWLRSLPEADLDALAIEVKRERARRAPLSSKTEALLARLRAEPLSIVAESEGLSRQYLYEVCSTHEVEPLRKRRKKKAPESGAS
jgi:hypothetical protein